MAGEDDGRPGPRVALQHPSDDLRGDRVDPFERLVQEQHFGIVQQGRRQADLLPHAGRVVDHQLVPRVAQIEHVQQLGGPLVGLGAGDPAQPAVVGEEFLTGEPLEEPQPLGQHPDPRLHRDRIGPHVVAADLDLAHVGPEQPRHHGERGRLARAVRPDQPDEPARRQVQIDPGDGRLRAEPLPQSPHPHGGHGSHLIGCPGGRGVLGFGPVRHGTTFQYPHRWGPLYERRVRASAASRAQAYDNGLTSSSASGSQRFAAVGRRAHWTAPRPPIRVGGAAM